MTSPIRYIPPKAAPLPPDADRYFASLSSSEMDLHHLATELLGSSYFIIWTPMYTKWKKAQAQKTEAHAAQAAQADTPAPS
jgi:hypothetical protein